MAQTVLFHRYRLLEPAGAGGSAEVWRARDEETGDIVAVKRLHPVVFADETARRRLQREFDALCTLDEPHIVQVRDLRIGDREAALILDYVDGESLATRLAGQTPEAPALELDAVVRIVGDISAALTAAHAAEIVHRDVTPGNILLTRDGQARLTDFGIARASADSTAVTATGLLMGTMRYLAPEQLRGGSATPASDLHALAAVAYEMVAGRPAYDAPTPVALADAQLAGPPRISSVPPAVDAAIRQALAVEPADRPADVRAFADVLASAAATDRVLAVDPEAQTVAIPVGALAGVATVGGGAAAEPTGTSVVDPIPAPAAVQRGSSVDRPARELRRPSGRHRVPAPVALVLGLLMAGAALAAATGLDQTAGEAAARASDRPSTPARVTPRPTPAPTPVPQADGEGNGNGNGKGNDDDKGKGKGKDGDKGNDD